MQLSNLSFLPESVLGWAVFLIVTVTLFVLLLNLKPKKNKTRYAEDLLNPVIHDPFQLVKEKALATAHNLKSEVASDDNSDVFISFKPELNEAFVVKLTYDDSVVTEIERTTYFVHHKEVSPENLDETKDKLDNAVDRGIDAFNNIISVDSDTFVEADEVIGMTNVVQKVDADTGETVLFTASDLDYEKYVNKLYHEGYEKA